MKLTAEYHPRSGEIVVYDFVPMRRADIGNRLTSQAYANALDDLRATTLDPEIHRMVAAQLERLMYLHKVQPVTPHLGERIECDTTVSSPGPDGR